MTAGTVSAAPRGAAVTLAGALNSALRDALRADDDVVVFGEDVAVLGGVFRVTDGLAREFGDDRCFDTPLAESAIVGTAIGMAMYGRAPRDRDAVRRVRLPGVRATRQPRRQVPGPHARRPCRCR